MKSFLVAQGRCGIDKAMLCAGFDHISKADPLDPRFAGGHPHTVTSDGYVTLGAPLETLEPWPCDYHSAVTILAIAIGNACLCKLACLCTRGRLHV
jgi:hypothetical protein